MAGLGWEELVLILLIVVIIFGAGKLPEIGGAVGRGIKEFRSATSSDDGTATNDETLASNRTGEDVS